jgi:hypothetical protein
MKKSYVVGRSDNYTINYVGQSDGTIKMFAELHPSDPYGASVTDNHLYPSGEICVSGGNAPETMDRAKAIAVHWMEGFSEYVRTGEFPNGKRRVHV